MSACTSAMPATRKQRGGSMQEGAGGLDVVVRVADRAGSGVQGQARLRREPDRQRDRHDAGARRFRQPRRHSAARHVRPHQRAGLAAASRHPGARRGDRRRPGPPHRLRRRRGRPGIGQAGAHRPAPRRLPGHPRGPDRRRDHRRQRADARPARRQGEGRDGDVAAQGRDRRGCRNEVRAFLRRPPDLRVGPLDRPADRRRHRLYAAAGRAISRDRTADDRRARRTIRAPTPRPWRRRSRRRSSRRSTASRTCSTCRPIRRATARCR